MNLLNLHNVINSAKLCLPIVLEESKKKHLVYILEDMDKKSWHNFQIVTGKNVYLYLTKNRKFFLTKNKSKTGIKIPIEDSSLENLKELAGINQREKVKLDKFEELEEEENIFFKIADLCKKIPALLVCENFTEGEYKYPTLKIAELYEEKEEVNILSSTTLKLKNTKSSHLYSFRTFPFLEEHYAIIINKCSFSNKTPFVRIHSANYMSDILDDTSSDCGGQLKKAIKEMGNSDGGIIIYLMQEGRGIGLINKIRALDIQEKEGLDTVEGNLFFGFNDDARPFNIASQILRLLGHNKIKLLSNNPNKAESLQTEGIEVLETIPHIAISKDVDRNYLKTKKEKLGHKID